MNCNELHLKLDTHFEKLQAEFTQIKWMLGFSLAISMIILFKIFN